jgi:abhydrolase domain-containing protein 13
MLITYIFEKLLSIGQLGLILLFFMLVMVYFMQEKMLYNPDFPSKEYKFPENNMRGFKHPGERGMLYHDVSIKTKDGLKLHGWLIKQKNPRDHDTIIYFHENAGNIGNRLFCIQNMYTELKVNVLIVGYRGYGHSEGYPSEEGLELDAEAIFEYAMDCPEINHERLFILGRSLGGAVAI